MPIHAQTYPPLGKVTVLDRDVLDLTAVLKVPHSQPGSPPQWEASLWYSVDGAADWSEARLSPCPEACPLQRQDSVTTRLYFRSSFTFKHSLTFTLKYRSDRADDWTWVRDEFNLEDGTVVRQSSAGASEDITVELPHLGAEWEIEKRHCDVASLWRLQAGVPRPCPGRGDPDEDTSTIRNFQLGLPRKPVLR